MIAKPKRSPKKNKPKKPRSKKSYEVEMYLLPGDLCCRFFI
jgi:hypothetical protein